VGRLRRWFTRRRVIVLALGVLAVVLVAGLAVWQAAAPAVTPTALTLPGAATSASDPTPVQLEADLYLPPGLAPEQRAPALLLAHGFGGSKASVAQDATAFAEAGFVVLAYSARGFGASTGDISMNDPDFEVADASALISHLATVPEVVVDAPDDPRVGIAGGSYGGALALMAAGYDPRVDAIAADITWNSLEDSLFGQSALDSDDLGAYKSLWSGLFFSSGQAPRPGDDVTECGRFTDAWCAAYVRAATTGTVDADGAALMRRSSPMSITDRITAPTLLGGGQADSLFPLAQVSANAEQIRAAHPDAPVKVVWHAGGHDGGLASPDAVTDQLRSLTIDWFRDHLADGPAVSTDFLFARTESSALSDRAAGTFDVIAAPQFPGLQGTSTQEAALAGPPQQVLAPAGGLPSAISSVPGLGGVGGLLGLAGVGTALGGEQQTATFVSEPLVAPLSIVGSPRARITIAADRPVEGATVFAAVRVLDGAGLPRLPAGLVAPVRLDALGPEPVEVGIELPAVVADVAAGSRIALTLTTTDQAYRMPAGPAVYSIALADPTVVVPTVTGTPVGGTRPVWTWPLLALGAVAILALVLLLTGRRRRAAGDPARLDDEPIVVTGLVKQYPGGVRAVDGVDFVVPRGTVLGLLGPNGAGKSTTMRMMMGLITPTSGEVRIFGERVRPGAAALARVGCFIEGPGLLPHLTGRQNLDLFWRASGRTGDPRMDDVLSIAGLGSAIDRRVRTYSQGMRQRVGIAQAMLGLPDLLILDEPTNGLDPPQIKEMREVMKAYATDGRTVIVSSHLLSEVEQTCREVVVMGAGRVIAQGTVEALLGEYHEKRLEDVFLDLVGVGHEVTTRGGAG